MISKILTVCIIIFSSDILLLPIVFFMAMTNVSIFWAEIFICLTILVPVLLFLILTLSIIER